MQLTQLTSKGQVKFNQFSKKNTKGFSKPLGKFIRQMQFGILKSGKVQLNDIGRVLQEKISLKKTTKRLGQHLGRSGYWLCNVTGVDKSGCLIVAAYSELYSLDKKSSSENSKILPAIDSVYKVVADDKILVDDRGGDRKNIMHSLVENDRLFIIRQVGNRDLYVNGEKKPLKLISRSVKLTHRYTVTKMKRNRKVKETYYCGAIKVKLTKQGKDLWLIVVKEKNKGYCWLLCNLKADNKKSAIIIAFAGYGHRWKIEEVHRQIKVDYELEGICLQRYDALKTMNALLWSAVSFLYTRLDSISIDIITHVELALKNRKRWADLIRFVYYKLAYALKKLLALSKLYNPPTFASAKSNQLCLELGRS
jgi:hypothetical protein